MTFNKITFNNHLKLPLIITFDNVNFDLQKHSGFKYISQLSNTRLVFK